MTAHDPINASFSTLASLKSQMLNLGIALDNTSTTLGTTTDDVTSGAGQFADQLQHGVVTFLLSWRSAFDTMSDGSSVVGNSIGKAAIDLAAVDAKFSSDIQL